MGLTSSKYKSDYRSQEQEQGGWTDVRFLEVKEAQV